MSFKSFAMFLALFFALMSASFGDSDMKQNNTASLNDTTPPISTLSKNASTELHTSITAEQSNQTVSNTTATTQTPSTEKSSFWTTFLIVGGVVLVVILVAGGLYYFVKSSTYNPVRHN